MHSYPFNHAGEFNDLRLRSDLQSVSSGLTFSTGNGQIIIYSETELSQSAVDALTTLINNHDPSPVESQIQRSTGLAQLVVFLDNRADDLRYADYFYRLQKRLLDLWRDKPNTAGATTEIYAALRGNRDTDANHLAMYNVFLWLLPKLTTVTLVSGELPASPTAAQAQQINLAAYVFAMNGVTMVNMLLLNQRL